LLLFGQDVVCPGRRSRGGLVVDRRRNPQYLKLIFSLQDLSTLQRPVPTGHSKGNAPNLGQQLDHITAIFGLAERVASQSPHQYAAAIDDAADRLLVHHDDVLFAPVNALAAEITLQIVLDLLLVGDLKCLPPLDRPNQPPITVPDRQDDGEMPVESQTNEVSQQGIHARRGPSTE
jgi:hypothetical protein